MENLGARITARLPVRCLIALAVTLPLLFAAFPARADGRPVSVVLKVVGNGGKPVPGAFVWITPFPSSFDPFMRKADAAGVSKATFASPAPADWVACVSAWSDGYALTRENVKAGATTVALVPGVAVRGAVKDMSGAPLAGVRVRLRMIAASDFRQGFAEAPMDEPRFTAVSAADGTFELPGGKLGWRATANIDDPRYVSSDASALIAPGSSISLVARPGATVTGKIVYAGGKPASGVGVYASGLGPSDNWARATTGTDGKYTLYGLTSGTVDIVADDDQRTLGWVAAAIQNVKVTEGKALAAPDMVMTHGGIVTGFVTDANGKPLPNVGVGSYGPHRPENQPSCLIRFTDQSGRYAMRVPPGKSIVYICGAPAGFLSATDNKHVTVSQGATLRQDFMLERGATVAGVVMDERGVPVQGVTMTFEKENEWNAQSWVSGNNGTFSATGVDKGNLDVRVNAPWVLVSPATIDTTSGLDLLSERIVVRKDTLTTIAGVVKSPSGDPVMGLEITAEIMPVGAGEGTTETADSDSAGRYTFPDVPAGHTVQLTFKKTGCLLKSGGVVKTVAGGGYTVSDAVFAALNGRVSGKVVDGQGNAVVGAMVTSPDQDSAQFATTDSSGAFLLSGLTEGSVKVLAGTATGFGSVETATGSVATIKLVLPADGAGEADTAFAKRILTGAIADTAKGGYYARAALPCAMAGTDRESAFALAAAMDGSRSHDARAAVVSAVIDLNDKAANDWIATKLASLGTGLDTCWLFMEMSEKGYRTDPEEALKYYDQGVDQIQRSKDASWMDLAMLTVYGTLIGAPNADRFYDVALAKAKVQPDRPGFAGGLSDFARIVGAASPEMAERAVTLLPADKRPDMLAQIARAMADYDPGKARRLLAVSGASPFYYAMTAAKIVDMSAATDSDGALALAHTIADPGHEGEALATVAAYRPAGERAGLYRQAFDLAIGDPASGYVLGPWIAALAYRNDPVEGAALFAKARAAVDAPVENDYERHSDLPFAFYAAVMAPAESRLRIERDFAKETTSNEQGWSWTGEKCAIAMAAVDSERAYQMSKQVPGEAGFDAQRKLVQYLCATDDVRRTLRFDRWGASDTWTPGTPTDW